jgi:hypothetical protein
MIYKCDIRALLVKLNQEIFIKNCSLGIAANILNNETCRFLPTEEEANAHFLMAHF